MGVDARISARGGQFYRPIELAIHWHGLTDSERKPSAKLVAHRFFTPISFRGDSLEPIDIIDDNLPGDGREFVFQRLLGFGETRAQYR